MNKRQNNFGSDTGNAVWQVCLDWLFNSKIRISSNLLFDEYVIDTIEKNKGKEHGYGYSHKISVNLKDESKKIINAHYSHIKVGTPTFRHEDGNNNFVFRNRPLGWMYGSDGFEHNVGFGLLY